MGAKRINLIGMKFGRYRVLCRSPVPCKTTNSWLCVCECGTFRSLETNRLKSGSAYSCGCYNREVASARLKTHGMTRSPEYNTWNAMKARCYNKNNKSYPSYGGRGITICERWLSSFENFYEDMGKRPEGHSIERVDVNGNYEPSNCKWITFKEQQFNKTYRNARLIDPYGIRHVVKGCYVSTFCNENRLSISKISLLLNGKRKQHKGWTGIYL